MGLRSRIDKWRNRITIRRQLSLLLGLLVFILLFREAGVAEFVYFQF